jgi:anthranilate phosphoribosyltransferase
MVVSGAIHARAVAQANGPGHFDELSILGPNTAGQFFAGTPTTFSTLDVSALPLQPAKLADLAGGDRKINARIVEALLTGQEHGPRREAVLLNAAAALLVASRANNLRDGWHLAAQTIDSGQAHKKLQELRQN